LSGTTGRRVIKQPLDLINRLLIFTRRPESQERQSMTENSIPTTANGAPAADRLRALLDGIPPELAPPAADSPAGRIMAATRELFAEAGFTGVTVRAISGHADVNVAMINYYFGSKDRLMDGVLSQELQHLLRDVVVGLDNEASAGQVLAEFPLRLLDSLRRDPRRLRLMRLAVSTEPDRLRRIIRALGEHSVLGVSRVLADLVSEAQTGGRVVAMTPRSVLLFLMANAYGLVFIEPIAREVVGFDLDDDAHWSEHRTHLARLVRQGLLAAPDLKEGSVA
jgi:AcrR family transcriptional regulator